MIKITEPKIIQKFSRQKSQIFNFDAREFRSKNFTKNYLQDRKKLFKRYKKFILTKKKPCPFCGCKKANEYLQLEHNYILYECQKCFLIFPNIDINGIHEFEEKEVKSHNHYVTNRKTHRATSAYRVNSFGVYKIEYLKKYAGLNSKKKVLDFGCGSGNFLSVLKHFKYNYIGFDPDISDINLCKEQKLNAVSNLTEIKGKFDIITLYDVLEHVIDINKTISLISKKLKRKGKIVIYVPNIHSSSFDLMGKYQNHTYPFEHFNFFSEKTIQILSKKNHLKINRIEYNGLDLIDYFLLKEFVDKKKYYEPFKEFINYAQSILDKHNLSNSMRVILSKV